MKPRGRRVLCEHIISSRYLWRKWDVISDKLEITHSTVILETSVRIFHARKDRFIILNLARFIVLNPAIRLIKLNV